MINNATPGFAPFDPAVAVAGGYARHAPAQLWPLITTSYVTDEAELLRQLLPQAELAPETGRAIDKLAAQLVDVVRQQPRSRTLVDDLMLEYGLDSDEGVVLMCLAETLLRVPDRRTAEAFLQDRLADADWQRHLRHSDSLLVNASTWGLLLTGRLLAPGALSGEPGRRVLARLVQRLGQPLVLQAAQLAAKAVARQFVHGRTIDEAIANGAPDRARGLCHSYDMLGEAALTAADAEAYFQAYAGALAALGRANKDDSCGPAATGPSLSIKLSALHPRYEATQRQRLHAELVPRLLALIRIARAGDIALTIDAEEQDRLELSLDLFEQLYRDPAVGGWGRLGLAVQAYGRRALPVLCWLAALARQQGDPIPVRLVKGAYWDSEIKWAQQFGLASYPVFTRKEATDTSFLVCARFLLSDAGGGLLIPQFASHNARTLASVHCLAAGRHFEYQRLHGMGADLHDAAREVLGHGLRIYAPVGSYRELLPYLARRLLENGANTSFVHRLADPSRLVSTLVRDPVTQLLGQEPLPNPRIPPPPDLFAGREQGDRRNSRGCNLQVTSQLQALQQEMAPHWQRQWQASSIIDGRACSAATGSGWQPVSCPFDREKSPGRILPADPDSVQCALNCAADGVEGWRRTSAGDRAACLERAADLLERHRGELIVLCQLEAGKILRNAVDEVREAVDFCRYYAARGRLLFAEPRAMPGVTGETNELRQSGRGVFVCISPWNFPLAIFTGQVMAALVAGNSVIAKPARPTSLIACRAVQLFLEAGIPGSALQLLLGDGREIGDALTGDPGVAGVAFTGSTTTARHINRRLAARDAPLAALVAETGGQNAMIADSTALPEQVVRDVLVSAFDAAGQRCSALRVLYLQAEIADRVLAMLAGAMAELVVGDPRELQTDIGPVIDRAAAGALEQHRRQLESFGRLVAEVPLAAGAGACGSFVAPVAYEIDSLAQLDREHFGPILHVIRYRADRLDRVIDEINACGYGLTLGIHSRISAFADHIADRVRVGNVYVNRNQIGAVVGSQPFGGQGLSGTGPKAGGPHYLLRFATEQTFTVNTAAIGGNAELLR